MVKILHVVDNGQGENNIDETWRPLFRHISPGYPTEEEKLKRTVTGLLNKLSPLNYCKIVEKFKSVIIDHSSILDSTATLIVEKAVTEPLFSKWYIEMLCSLTDIFVIDEIHESTSCCLRELFVEKLFELFEDLKTFKLGNQIRAEMKACTDPKNKAELEEKLDKTESMQLSNCRGVGRVIAESFLLGIITTSIVTRFIDDLLASKDENSLECLNELLGSAGKCLEFQLDEMDFDSYFKSVQEICDDLTLPARIRFIFLNLIDFKNNSWASKGTSYDLKTIEDTLNELSTMCSKSGSSSSAIDTESEFQIDAKEAQYVNKILNKFTHCRRNLADVINFFNELEADEKSRLIKVFITCVVKGDIYSEDCGKLCAVLIQTGSVDVSVIATGTKSVVKGYCQNLIFADQQIYIRLKEIFRPMFMDEVIKLEDLDLDFGDIKKAKSTANAGEKKNKAAANPKKYEKTAAPLVWQRGVPVKDKGERSFKVIKKKSESEKKSESDQQENNEKA